jgi:hypothetical protein
MMLSYIYRLFRELKLKSKGHMQRIVLADIVQVVGSARGDVVLHVVAGTVQLIYSGRSEDWTKGAMTHLNP